MLVLALLVSAIGVAGQPARAADHPVVTASGESFLIDGAIANAGSDAEGLLLNSRSAQAVFDDENPATVDDWAYSDTGVWDPERNTDEFIAALPSFRDHGLDAVTVSLQGGNPVAGCSCNASHDWITTAYNPDGSLKAAWMDRLDRVILRRAIWAW